MPEEEYRIVITPIIRITFTYRGRERLLVIRLPKIEVKVSKEVAEKIFTRKDLSKLPRELAGISRRVRKYVSEYIEKQLPIPKNMIKKVEILYYAVAE